MRTSVYPNFASGAAIVKSHSVAIPQPPAIAAPFTAAISGFGKTTSRRNIRAIRRESSRFCSSDWLASAFRASRSMPEQNAAPVPVMIATRAGAFSISIERGQQFLDHLRGNGVALFGTIQRDRRKP